MNKIFLIATICFAACCTTKQQHVVNDETGKMIASRAGNAAILPDCIAHLIDSFKNESIQNPPRKIYKYEYAGMMVYYIPPVCCDQFSNLFDSDCNLISHPDGGFTGRGDGKTPDFITERKNEKLIWEDERK